ncbi:hypothetical protein [Actinokineospora enzanensis]|uniref:hypothetical protein n=1 Tax=Actinokineospora enzanensis TaxID=155975 RepID=UPI0003706A59|nr:hypothetical protein [Actinokineospora enzanensis]
MRTLAAIVLSAGLTITGAASAGADDNQWARYHEGAFADRQSCDEQAADMHNPPYSYTYPCGYLATDPEKQGRGAGWYYFLIIDIR